MSTLTATVGHQVILINGAKAANVCWQIGRSATLGTSSVSPARSWRIKRSPSTAAPPERTGAGPRRRGQPGGQHHRQTDALSLHTTEASARS
ncbi:MAG TPA: ice-binding family protein [Polyangia bacterium]|nr:ice-binding family protein [Polyangia bacterium]